MNALRLNLNWLEAVWKKQPTWERDYFLPVPTKFLTHWERYEWKYAEATILSQVLEVRLILNGEHLMCQGVAGKFWREHSPASIPYEVHGLSQLPNQLAERYWWLVTRAVASLRAHHEAKGWFDAEKSGTHASCR